MKKRLHRGLSLFIVVLLLISMIATGVIAENVNATKGLANQKSLDFIATRPLMPCVSFSLPLGKLLHFKMAAY